MTTLHLIIKGRVQGVFFRANVKKKAEELGLVGFCRNLADGSVQVVASGTHHELGELVRYIRGNPGASLVESITEHRLEHHHGRFERFEIRD